MTFLDRTIPNGDRDDAPELPLPSARVEDAPPLTDETDSSRLARLGRNATEGNKWVMEALRLLAEGKHANYRTAMVLAAEQLTDAASLARRLSDPRTSRATKE